MSLTSETLKSVVELRRSATFNLWQIGSILFEAERLGLNLLHFFNENEGELGISYKRGMAIKLWYGESFKNPVLDVKKLGIDKTLALIEPRKAYSEDFIKEYSQEKLERMTVSETRESVGEFIERKGGASRADKYFSQAEVSLEGVLGMFTGAISSKYREEYANWPGRERVVRLLEKLKSVLGDL